MGLKDFSKRKAGLRQRNPVIYIFCEDQKSAKKYFEEMRQKIQCRSAKIEILSRGNADPLRLVKYVRKYIKDNQNNIIKGKDAFFCVFDEDGRGDKKLQEIEKELSQKHGSLVTKVFSNPSFELWYLLHFIDQNAALNNNQLIQKLQKSIPNYSKSEGYYNPLEKSLQTAIKRAKDMNEMHKRNGTKLFSQNSNPSTQIFLIFECLCLQRLQSS